MQYQKDFVRTGTSFSLASYRYSSSGYDDFSEANALESPDGQLDHKRSREELSVARAVGSLSSLAISAYSQHYWHSSGHDETVHPGSIAPGKDRVGSGLLLHAICRS